MRIACPSCNAAYQVPDEQLLEGRVVRCARCGTDWTPNLPVPKDEPAVPREPAPAAPEPVHEPEPIAPPRQMALEEEEELPPLPTPAAVPEPTPPSKRRGLPLLALAWVASVVIVAAGAGLLVTQRDRVMSAWPPSTRLYAAIGLQPRH